MSEEDPLLTSEAPSQNEFEKPLPLRELLTREVIVSSVNYALLALVEISFRALQPLFLSTPVAVGGLGLDPPIIGTVMSVSGVLSVFFIFFFSQLMDYFGAKWVYVAGISASVPCFFLFPVINHLARNSIEHSGGLGTGVWVAVWLQVLLSVLITRLCYGARVSKHLRPPVDLISFFVPFRCGVHLRRRRRSQ